jgi:hypothetical protein
VQTYTRHRFGPDGMVDPAPGVPLTMMAYELWPEALGATIRRAAEITGAPVLSILNRGSGADIGALMLSYGGGHANAGTCQVPHDQADRVVDPQAPPSRVGHVADRAEVTELVGVDDRADGLDAAVGDVEGEDAEQAAGRVEDERAGVAVDLGRGDDHADGAAAPGQAEEEPRDPLGAVDGDGHGRGLAAAVAVDDGVGGQQADQALGVALVDGGEEPAGELLALAPGGLEPRPAGLDVAAGSGRDLAAVVLGPADEAADLGVAVAKHLVEQEHRPLDR